MSYNYHLDSSCGNGENWPSVFFIGLFNFLIIKVTHLVYREKQCECVYTKQSNHFPLGSGMGK